MGWEENPKLKGPLVSLDTFTTSEGTVQTILDKLKVHKVCRQGNISARIMKNAVNKKVFRSAPCSRSP